MNANTQPIGHQFKHRIKRSNEDLYIDDPDNFDASAADKGRLVGGVQEIYGISTYEAELQLADFQSGLH